MTGAVLAGDLGDVDDALRPRRPRTSSGWWGDGSHAITDRVQVDGAAEAKWTW